MEQSLVKTDLELAYIYEYVQFFGATELVVSKK